jgi:beta-phosphoglucomutase-like phosphatase (HAD superfamily)
MSRIEGRFLAAIVFDAEGVVVDTEPIWDDVQAEFLARRGIPYDRSLLKPLLSGRTVIASTRIFKSRFGLKGSTPDLARERIELMRARLSDGVRFLPGFVEFYARVANSYDIAIATSLDPDLLSIVDRELGLTAMFNGVVVTSADVQGRGKPKPDIFVHAAYLLGDPVERCLVLEDSPSGIRAALAARMYAVGLTSTHTAHELAEADHVVSSFTEIDMAELDRLAEEKWSKSTQ